MWVLVRETEYQKQKSTDMQFLFNFKTWVCVCVCVCVLTGSRAEGSPLCIGDPCGASSSSSPGRSWCVWGPSVALEPSRSSTPAQQTIKRITGDERQRLSNQREYSCGCHWGQAVRTLSLKQSIQQISDELSVPRTDFLRSFSPAPELSSCMLKKARMPSSFGCR